MRLKPGHDARILLLALLGGLPGIAGCFVLLAIGGYSGRVQWTVGVFIVVFWLACCFAARERVASTLRTLASLLEAMREGDYSIRGRVVSKSEALGEVMEQVNAMGTTLHAQRLGALEATALLRKVMEEIDVAVFAFDLNQQLRLVNRAGEKLLAQPAQRMLGRDANSLALAEFLIGPAEQTLQRNFAGQSGRWGIRRSNFREGGIRHQLLVVTDLTRPLREQELQAWQRLVRVLGHELNNSLTPIRSIARSLELLLKADPQPEDWGEDMERGLNVIATRSEALSRFLSAYAQLAKLPAPRFSALDLSALLRRVVSLETRRAVFFEEMSSQIVQADSDQLEQALINLIRNAVDATTESGGRVFVTLVHSPNAVDICVRDEGPGIANPANLFVPFFTTKRGGSGIGLVLSRQIAEAHHGSLTLRNVVNGPGCEAVLTLPKSPPAE